MADSSNGRDQVACSSWSDGGLTGGKGTGALRSSWLEVSGSNRLKRAPLSDLPLSTTTLPPWECRIFCTMESPSP